MFDTVIRSGNIVLPGKEIIYGDIGIQGEKIVAVSKDGGDFEGKEVIDAEGKFVFPGIIEPHSHMGLAAGDDDLITETSSAALGGITTILFFLRQPLPYTDLYNHIIETAATKSYIDFSFHITLLTEEHINSIPKYIEDLGVTSFKIYLTYRGKDALTGIYGGKIMNFESLDDGFVLDAFKQIGRYRKAMAIVHAEDIEIVNRYTNKMLKAGRDDMEAYALSRPVFAEVEGIRRAINFAKHTDSRINILHLTSSAGFEAFKAAKADYDKCYAEVCQMYLMFDESHAISGLYKARPPLRTDADKKVLWEGLISDQIETLGSDHVPRKKAGKMGSIWNVTSGTPGTPFLFLNMLEEAYYNYGVTLPFLAEKMSLKPAKLYGLYPQKGDIAPGCDADLVIVDLNKKTVLNMDNFPSFSDFNLYEGKIVRASIDRTIVRGRTVAKEGKLCAPNGGKFVFR